MGSDGVLQGTWGGGGNCGVLQSTLGNYMVTRGTMAAAGYSGVTGE